MIHVLVALGPNRLEIPAMFWSSFDEALKQSISILGPPTNSSRNKWSIYEECYDEISGNKYFHFLSPEAPKYPRRNDFDSLDRYKIALDNWHKVFLKEVDSRKIFTSYYGGCGECSGFILQSFEEGVPTVAFNLD